jgi:hypothetical protein
MSLIIKFINWVKKYLLEKINIIDEKVKKDHLTRELEKEVQVLKGKQIRFRIIYWCRPYILIDVNRNDITKEDIYIYIRIYILILLMMKF